MAGTYLSTGILGAKIGTPTTAADFELGTVSHGNQNEIWLYVQASEAIATGTCTVDAAFALTDTAGDYTADVAFASGEYGWVRLTAGAS